MDFSFGLVELCMGFSRFLGVEEFFKLEQDFAFVGEWLTQNSFKIVFECVINISLFAKHR